MRDDARTDAVFQALADGTRRQILRSLAGDGETTATALARSLPISRQAVSKHLALLRDIGLVASRQEGRETRYHLQPDRLEDVTAWVEQVNRQWDERLARLRRRAERRRGDR